MHTFALFYVTKTVLVGPNVIHFGRKSRFGPDQFILVVTISFWSRPNNYGQVQINLVRPKPFWTNQNSFGHIEGQGINAVKFLDWLKKYWQAQNILGLVKGQGMRRPNRFGKKNSLVLSNFSKESCRFFSDFVS